MGAGGQVGRWQMRGSTCIWRVGHCDLRRASAVPVVYNYRYVGTSTYVRDGNCGDTKTPPLKYYDLDEKHKISRVISASSFQ